MTYKEHVKSLCKAFRHLVYAGEYAMNIVWADEDKDASRKDCTVGAEIWIDVKYLRFEITFYPSLKKYYDEKNYYTLAEIILHEFCHLLTEPLYLEAFPGTNDFNREYLEDIRERQTQRITNALMVNIQRSVYEPKQPKKPKEAKKKK